MKDWKKFEDALKNKVQKDYPVDEALMASMQASLDVHFPAETGKRGFAWFMLTTIVSVTSIIGYVLSKPNQGSMLVPTEVTIVEQDDKVNMQGTAEVLSTYNEITNQDNQPVESTPAVEKASELGSELALAGQSDYAPQGANPGNSVPGSLDDAVAGKTEPNPTMGTNQFKRRLRPEASNGSYQTPGGQIELNAGNTTTTVTRAKIWPDHPLVRAMYKSDFDIEQAYQPTKPKTTKARQVKPRKLFTYSVEADYTYIPWFINGDSSGEQRFTQSYTNEITSSQSARVKFNTRWKNFELRTGIGRTAFANQLTVNQRDFITTSDTTYRSYRVIDSSFDAGTRTVWLIQTEHDINTQSTPLGEKELYNKTDQVRYWNIPLSLSYVQPVKRFELGVNLGVDILFSPSFTTSFSTQDDSTGEGFRPYASLNKSLVQKNASVRLGYRANYHTTIYAEARNNWSGRHFFSTTSYANRSRGVTIGINYRF